MKTAYFSHASSGTSEAQNLWRLYREFRSYLGITESSHTSVEQAIRMCSANGNSQVREHILRLAHAIKESDLSGVPNAQRTDFFYYTSQLENSPQCSVDVYVRAAELSLNIISRLVGDI